MKKYILVLILLIPVFLFAQEETDKPALFIKAKSDVSKGSLGMQYEIKLRKYMNQSFSMNTQAPFVVTATLLSVKYSIIEGMETFHYADVAYKVHLLNKVTGEEKEWAFDSKGKGTSEMRAANAAFVSATKSKKAFGGWAEEMMTYVKEELSGNCTAYVQKAKEHLAENKYRLTLSALKLIDEKSNCYAARKTVEDAAINGYQQAYCDKEMQQIKVLANSGMNDKMRTAIRMLVKIAPDAPCAAEAIQVSKTIGEAMKARPGKANEQLTQYQTLMINGDKENWRSVFFSER